MPHTNQFETDPGLRRCALQQSAAQLRRWAAFPPSFFVRCCLLRAVLPVPLV